MNVASVSSSVFLTAVCLVACFGCDDADAPPDMPPPGATEFVVHLHHPEYEPLPKAYVIRDPREISFLRRSMESDLKEVADTERMCGSKEDYLAFCGQDGGEFLYSLTKETSLIAWSDEQRYVGRATRFALRLIHSEGQAHSIPLSRVGDYSATLDAVLKSRRQISEAERMGEQQGNAERDLPLDGEPPLTDEE
jgi:hypothetical protein